MFILYAHKQLYAKQGTALQFDRVNRPIKSKRAFGPTCREPAPDRTREMDFELKIPSQKVTYS